MSGTGTDPSSATSPSGTPSRHLSKRNTRLVTVAAVVIVGCAIGAAYVLTDGFVPAGSSGTEVLLPAKAYYSIPGAQYNAIAFLVQKTSVVTGTFTNTKGITLYQMTPAELLSLSKTGNIGNFSWTSGRIANLTVTDLSLTVQPGSWDLVFFNSDNPSPVLNPNLNTTIVGFYTNLTVSPN